MPGHADAQDRRRCSVEQRRSAGVGVGQCLSVSGRAAACRAGQVQRPPAVSAQSDRHQRLQQTVSRCSVRQLPRQMHQERYIHAATTLCPPPPKKNDADVGRYSIDIYHPILTVLAEMLPRE